MGQEALSLDIITQSGGSGNSALEVTEGHLGLQLIVLEGFRWQLQILQHISQIGSFLGHEVGGSQEESGATQKTGHREVS